MNILEWRQSHEPPTSRGFETIVTFDVEVADGVRLYNVALVQAPDGTTLVYAPQTYAPGSANGRRRAATFRQDVGTALATAILGKLGNDRHTAEAA